VSFDLFVRSPGEEEEYGGLDARADKTMRGGVVWRL
jgi:hypothetical protein